MHFDFWCVYWNIPCHKLRKIHAHKTGEVGTNSPVGTCGREARVGLSGSRSRGGLEMQDVTRGDCVDAGPTLNRTD